MLRLGAFIRNPFSFLFAQSSTEDRVCSYVIREHERGRSLHEILDDRYVRNRLNGNQLRRLLERPEIVHAIGDSAVEQARRELQAVTSR